MENISKVAFAICVIGVSLGGGFLFGAIAYKEDYTPIPQLRLVGSAILSGDLFADRKGQHMQPSRGQGAGVTKNTRVDDETLVFLVGFFEDETQLRLIKHDGSVVKKWTADYLEHFQDPRTRVCDFDSPLEVDVHGAHVTSRGEVVFNYEYCGTVKLDQCGDVIWTLPTYTHHSLVPAEKGGYWALSRFIWKSDEEPERFPPFSNRPNTIIEEDTLLRMSEAGEILEEVSIPEIIRENGLVALLTATGGPFSTDSVIRPELVHANKLAELPSAIADSYPLFAAGDLVISMRDLNLVMVIDPVSKKVKWHQTGPWLRQHDPEFRPDGRISIFNNNGYLHGYIDNQTDLSAPRLTNIMVVDPVSGATEVAFGGKPGQEMLSVIRGEHALLPDDAMLITEFDAGRVLEVNAEREIVWEYVNAYDENFVGEITNAAVVSETYFEVEWKSCSSQ